MDDETVLAEHVPASDPHRRRAAHLYGLIVSGAVLASATADSRLGRVAVMLLCTLVIYWAAETYVHWIAARTLVQRDLSRAERRTIVRDGWPLVAACAVPVLFLAIEALLGVESELALDVTLAVNAVLLFVIGWRMGRAGGLTGAPLALSTGTSGLLGIALIALKTLLH
jgi:hypothetical protein